MSSKKKLATYDRYGFGKITMKKTGYDKGLDKQYKHRAGGFWFKTKGEADLHRQMKKVGVKITDISTGKTRTHRSK